MRSFLVLGLAAAFVAPAAAERRSAGPLAIRAPDQVVLGRDATIELAMHVPAPGVRLVSSVGSLSAPRRSGDEQRVSFELPAQRYPQVALVAAVGASGDVLDWLAIPLSGQASIKVTTDPRASVTVRVGAASFGPTLADGRGIASVPIVVPPGTTEATTIARTHAGDIERTATLGTPPSPRALLTCSAVGARATILSVLPDGSPANTPPSFSVSSGDGEAQMSAPGRFDIDIREVGAAETVQVTVGDERARCDVTIPPTPPTSIVVTADRATFTAGDAPLAVTVTPRYGTGRPATVERYELEADLGIVAVDEAGATTWRLPSAFDGKTHSTVRVSAIVGGRVVATGELVVALRERAPVARAPRSTHLELVASTGVLANLGRLTAPIVTAGARVHLAALDDALVPELVLGAASSSLDVGTDEMVGARVTVAPVLARLGYHRRVGTLEAWGGAGAGLAIVWTSLASESTGEVRGMTLRLAAVGFVGVSRRVGPGHVVAEASYLHATLDGDIRGRVGGVIGTVGYAVGLW